MITLSRPSHQDLLNVIFQAIEDVNPSLPMDRQITQTEGAILVGRDGPLDSLGLINLLVAVEHYANSRFGKTPSLFDDRIFSNSAVTLKDVQSLAKRLGDVIEEEIEEELRQGRSLAVNNGVSAAPVG